MIEEENAKGKVKAVYDELRSVFGKVPGLCGKGDTPCLQNHRHRCGWAQGMRIVGRAGPRRATLVVELFSDINHWGSVTKMIELVAS